VLGPVAVNPYLEPYHLVPLVVPAVVLVATAAHHSRRVRVVATIGFVLALAIVKVSCPWPMRGLLVNVQALILCGTAVWIAWARVAAPGEVSGQVASWRVVVPARRKRHSAPVRRKPKLSATPSRAGAVLVTGLRRTK
jgi:hypothetical protein